MSDLTANREKTARTLAMVDDYDGCFERVDQWNALEQWERDAYPDEEPHSDREDCEFWLRRADALFTEGIIVPANKVRADEVQSLADDTEKWKLYDGDPLRSDLDETWNAVLDGVVSRLRERATELLTTPKQ